MKERLQYADALRCLAICFVIILHVINPFVGKASLVGTPSWFFCIAQNTLNRTGVPLFFMLNDKSEVRGVVSGDTLVVKCKNPFTVTIADTPEVIAALKKSAANVLGRNVAVKLTEDDGSEEVAEDKLDALSRFDIISFE